MLSCLKPFKVMVDGAPEKDFLTGCGHCAWCKKQKAAEWSTRLYHEKAEFENSIFLTLTYREENLPKNNSIKKREFQKFLKRLRKYIEKGYYDKIPYLDFNFDLYWKYNPPLNIENIKYYSVGEYGGKYGRPHYHAIMFGLPNNKIVKKYIYDAWNQGLIHIGIVTPASIRYCANYIHKKLFGTYADIYTDKGQEVPWQLQSKGIGLRYVLDKNNRESLLRQKIVAKGKERSAPKYYTRKLKEIVDNKQNLEIMIHGFENQREGQLADNERILDLSILDNQLHYSYRSYKDIYRQELAMANNSTIERRSEINKKKENL